MSCLKIIIINAHLALFSIYFNNNSKYVPKYEVLGKPLGKAFYKTFFKELFSLPSI